MNDVRVGLGPAQTDWGFKYWSLLLGPEFIVAVRYTFKESFKLAFHLNLGFPADPGVAIRAQGTRFAWQQRPDRRYYAIADLRAITLKVSHGLNHVTLGRRDNTSDRYSILKREDTQAWRDTLQSLYSRIYDESGVPDGWLGKIAKS